MQNITRISMEMEPYYAKHYKRDQSSSGAGRQYIPVPHHAKRHTNSEHSGPDARRASGCPVGPSGYGQYGCRTPLRLLFSNVSAGAAFLRIDYRNRCAFPYRPFGYAGALRTFPRHCAGTFPVYANAQRRTGRAARSAAKPDVLRRALQRQVVRCAAGCFAAQPLCRLENRYFAVSQAI